MKRSAKDAAGAVVSGADVFGVGLDGQTRCAHWHGPDDILAIKFCCCNTYYACYECHAALAGHAAEVWSRAEFGQHALLCGACRGELTIEQYLGSGSRCGHCGAAFNPRCSLHHPLYFATGVAADAVSRSFNKS